MADERQEMAELRRQLQEANAARAALQMQVDSIPRNAQQYMHPELHVPDPAIVLPRHPTGNYEIKPNFIQLIKGSTF